MRDVDAAQPERAPGHQPVRVVAVTDPHRPLPPGAADRFSCCSAAARSSGSVSFQLSGSPRTTATAMPSHSTSCASSVAVAPLRAGLGERLAQQLDAKHLRRLRGPALGARGRLDHAAGAHALDGVGDRHRQDGGSAGAGGLQDARDRGRPHERPGGVVHRNPLDVRPQRREPRPHRVLALGAAKRRRSELRDGGELGREALPALEIGPGDHGHHRLDHRRRGHRGEGVRAAAADPPAGRRPWEFLVRGARHGPQPGREPRRS